MKQIVVISAILAIVAISSCGSNSGNPRQPKNVVALIDLSASRDSSIIDWYKQVVTNTILENLGPKDKLSVLPIDKGSLTAGGPIFTVDFSRNNYSNQYDATQAGEAEKKRHKDSVAAAILQFSKVFNTVKKARSDFKSETDVFGALQQASNKSLPDYDCIGVCLSDMLQSTAADKLDFEHHLNRLVEIDGYLSRVRKVDLNGWKVYVLTGNQANITSEKFAVVDSFYERYIQKCGGQLVDYNSGDISVLEQILSH